MMNLPLCKRLAAGIAVLALFGGFALTRLGADAQRTEKAGAPTIIAENTAVPAEKEKLPPQRKSPEKEIPGPPPAARSPHPIPETGCTGPDFTRNNPSPSPAQLPGGADGILPHHPATDAAQPEPLPPPPGSFPRTWASLTARLEADDVDPLYAREAFAALQSPPLPEFMAQKAVELYARYGKAALTVPDAEKDAYEPPDYTRAAGGMTVAAGRKVMMKNAGLFENLYKRYGVPAPFIVAVLMVETGIGTELGRQSALLALGSMAVTKNLADVLPLTTGIPPGHPELDEAIRARSEWAYAEVKALLLYARQSGKNVSTMPGSVYGAIGICQFMPSNIALFGASASSRRAVPNVFILPDAAASVARYLSAHGWKKALTPKAQLEVLFSYNHSEIYASTVYGVAMSLTAPTTHNSAQNARAGGNAVRAARENARESIPAAGKKGSPLGELPDYSKLLE